MRIKSITYITLLLCGITLLSARSASAVDSVKFKINSQLNTTVAPPSGFSLRVFDLTSSAPLLTSTDPLPTNSVFFTTATFDALLGHVGNYQEGKVYTLEYQPYYSLQRLGTAIATSSGTWVDSQMYYCLDDIYATFFPVDGHEDCSVLENPFDFKLINRLYNQSGWVDCADNSDCLASDGLTGTWVNFYGLFDYPAPSTTLTLQVKITGINSAVHPDGTPSVADGITTLYDAATQTLTKTTTFTTPSHKQFFNIPFNANELGQGNFGASGGQVTVTLSDGTDTATSSYVGRLRITTPDALDLNENNITALYDQTLTTFAGAIFFPAGATPHIQDGSGAIITSGTLAGADYYCLQSTGCFNFDISGKYQLWTKDIAGVPYPFLVGFYGLPQSQGDLKILDSTW